MVDKIEKKRKKDRQIRGIEKVTASKPDPTQAEANRFLQEREKKAGLIKATTRAGARGAQQKATEQIRKEGTSFKEIPVGVARRARELSGLVGEDRVPLVGESQKLTEEPAGSIDIEAMQQRELIGPQRPFTPIEDGLKSQAALPGGIPQVQDTKVGNAINRLLFTDSEDLGLTAGTVDLGPGGIGKGIKAAKGASKFAETLELDDILARSAATLEKLGTRIDAGVTTSQRTILIERAAEQIQRVEGFKNKNNPAIRSVNRFLKRREAEQKAGLVELADLSKNQIDKKSVGEINKLIKGGKSMTEKNIRKYLPSATKDYQDAVIKGIERRKVNADLDIFSPAKLSKTKKILIAGSIVGSTIGLSTLAIGLWFTVQWYGADNKSQQAVLASTKIYDSVIFSGRDPTRGKEQMEGWLDDNKEAAEVIKTGMRFFPPILSATGETFLEGNADNERQILQLIEGIDDFVRSKGAGESGESEERPNRNQILQQAESEVENR